MTTRLLCVGPDDVPAVWPAVERFIADAYEKTDRLVPDVLGWLAARKGLLWIAVEVPGPRIVAAATSSLESMRGGLSCRIVAGGGDGGVDVWKRHISDLEDYARVEGCYKLWFEGRHGWGRVLPGYVPTTVVFERRL